MKDPYDGLFDIIEMDPKPVKNISTERSSEFNKLLEKELEKIPHKEYKLLNNELNFFP